MWTGTRFFGAATALMLLGAAGLPAEPCQTGEFEGVPYTYCEVDPASEDIRLWHTAPDGRIYGTFDRINEALEDDGLTLGFAMNGGMYHEDRSPVGLYIEDGQEHGQIVTSDGPGNFGLLPNGVFCTGNGFAEVIESRAFAARPQTCTFATQSGPLLVENGNLHPRFLPDSSSRHVRNGVGVRPDGTVVFAISDKPVNFHRFARIFRDDLGAPDALYIDGSVSRLYAPDLNRHDIGFPLGPIVGTVVPLD